MGRLAPVAHDEGGWTRAQLIEAVNQALEEWTHLPLQFEANGVLGRMEEYGLVDKKGEHYRAVPLAGALEALRNRWAGAIAEDTTDRWAKMMQKRAMSDFII